MSRFRNNDCVGCDYCVNCGRNKWYTVIECDKCGAEFYNEDEITRIDGEDICQDCLYEGSEDDDEE